MSKTETITVWCPKGFSSKKVLDVLISYGAYNDTLAGERYDENIVPYRIIISVEKINEKDSEQSDLEALPRDDDGLELG